MAGNPDYHIRPGFFMTFSVMDFARPRRDDIDPDAYVMDLRASDPEDEPVSASSLDSSRHEERAEPAVTSPPVLRPVDDDYPEWLDENPPWRNPESSGPTYLYVWEQHPYRIRGHH